MAIMDNQQLSLLTREQLQVFLTARLGDGCITTSNSNSTYYITNCKFEEYIDFKSISFNRLERELSIYGYRKNATCTEFLENATNTNINYLNNEELQAIFKICKELGWNK